MLRLVAKKVIQSRQACAGERFMMSSIAPAAVPSVKDLLINLTFVDPSGARRKVKGLIGK